MQYTQARHQAGSTAARHTVAVCARGSYTQNFARTLRGLQTSAGAHRRCVLHMGAQHTQHQPTFSFFAFFSFLLASRGSAGAAAGLTGVGGRGCFICLSASCMRAAMELGPAQGASPAQHEAACHSAATKQKHLLLGLLGWEGFTTSLSSTFSRADPGFGRHLHNYL